MFFVSCHFQAHISSPNAELSQAALQALGFCVYHSHVVSGVPGTQLFFTDALLGLYDIRYEIADENILSSVCFPETFAADILSALCSLVVKSTDKNTCTRALWVISKQSFSPDVVAKKVSISIGLDPDRI